MATVTEDLLLDKATIAAIKATKPSGRKNEPVVDKTTMNNLLTFLQSTRNVKELEAYILRQIGRGEIDPDTGRELLSTLSTLNLDQALLYLGYLKWLYEAITGVNVDRREIENVKKFDELVKKLAEKMR